MPIELLDPGDPAEPDVRRRPVAIGAGHHLVSAADPVATEPHGQPVDRGELPSRVVHAFGDLDVAAERTPDAPTTATARVIVEAVGPPEDEPLDAGEGIGRTAAGPGAADRAAAADLGVGAAPPVTSTDATGRGVPGLPVDVDAITVLPGGRHVRCP